MLGQKSKNIKNIIITDSNREKSLSQLIGKLVSINLSINKSIYISLHGILQSNEPDNAMMVSCHHSPLDNWIIFSKFDIFSIRGNHIYLNKVENNQEDWSFNNFLLQLEYGYDSR